MIPFCTDVDLLHWEPNIFREAAFASQTLLSGTGELAGTSFTLDGGGFDLQQSKVSSEQVIYLGPPFDGCYPIVKIDSATQLTLSVLYDGLFPEDGERESAPAGSASDVAFTIRTFWPQRRIVSELLLQAAGLRSDQSAAVVSAATLRRACTLGTLQMIYSALAAAAQEPHLAVRADLYQRLYRRALRSATVEIDTNGDGVPESRRALNVITLQRR